MYHYIPALPETIYVAPENRASQKGHVMFQPAIFKGLVSGRVHMIDLYSTTCKDMYHAYMDPKGYGFIP